MRLRLASYNIHRAIGRDGIQDPTRIARVLGDLDADVIALQEVAYRTAETEDVLGRLGAELGARPVEGITLLDERGHYGNGLLTRLPVERVRRHDLSWRGREPRGAVEIDLALGGRSIQLITTHLGLRPAERRQQLRTLLERVTGSDADIRILLGDLNEWFLWGRPLRWLRRVFGPTEAPRTFPAHRPALALDRVWVRPGHALSAIRAHRSPLAHVASDHLPLVAELDLGVAGPEG